MGRFSGRDPDCQGGGASLARSFVGTSELVLCTCLLLSALAVSQGSAQQPWGYLWELRTHRLHPLVDESIRIGRLADSQVVLTEGRVSRRHAQIQRGPDGLNLTDSGSSNGTRLNGVAVRPGESARLQSGDLIELAYEKLIFHESLSALWPDALRLSFLSSLVRLRVPVVHDRNVKSLGKLRTIAAVSVASVDAQSGEVQMSYPDGVQESGFPPGRAAFVGNLSIEGGELRVSLWGLGKEEDLVSRRASFSQLRHGELRIVPAAPSHREATERLEEGWRLQGVRFLFPVVAPVLETYPSDETTELVLKLVRSLLEQSEPTGLRDAADCLALRFRLDSGSAEVALLASRAEARWARRMVETHRNTLSEADWRALEASVALSRGWLGKAAALGAERKSLEEIDTEILEAEGVMGRLP